MRFVVWAPPQSKILATPISLIVVNELLKFFLFFISVVPNPHNATILTGVAEKLLKC